MHRHFLAHLPAAIFLTLVALSADGAATQSVDFKPAIRRCGTLLSDRLDVDCGSRWSAAP